MKKFIFLAVLLSSATCFAQARAAEYNLRAKEVAGQSVEYDHGYATVSSHLSSSDINLTYIGTQHGRRLVFSFDLVNKSEAKIDIGPENIMAKAGDVPLHVYDTDELIRKERSRAIWESVAVGAVHGVDDAVGTEQSTIHTDIHAADTTYSSTTHVYSPNPAIQEENAIRSQQMISNINAVRDGNIAEIENNLVQLTTVKPGYVFHGIIVVDPPKPDQPAQVGLTLNFGSDAHVFIFGIAPRR